MLNLEQEAKLQEILDILQEECAEVIQSISKCRRFGLNNKHKDGLTQREQLTQELGDVTLLIELLKAYGVFTESELHEATLVKASKLKIWSKIYD